MMSESKFTPGPWIAVPDPDGDPVVVTYRDDVDPKDWEPSFYNCSITSGIGDHTERRTSGNEWANAKLIAAAPDLVTDLILAASTLRRYEQSHRAKGTEESTDKAEVNADLATRFEATIRKATA